MACLVSQHAGADPIRPRKLKHCHMRQEELLEACRIKLFDNTPLDDLTRDSQQGPDEHVLISSRARVVFT